MTHDILHVISALYAERDFHTIVPGHVYVLDTVRGAVRILKKKILNCGFQCDYYHFYYYYYYYYYYHYY